MRAEDRTESVRFFDDHRRRRHLRTQGLHQAPPDHPVGLSCRCWRTAGSGSLPCLPSSCARRGRRTRPSTASTCRPADGEHCGRGGPRPGGVRDHPGGTGGGLRQRRLQPAGPEDRNGLAGDRCPPCLRQLRLPDRCRAEPVGSSHPRWTHIRGSAGSSSNSSRFASTPTARTGLEDRERKVVGLRRQITEELVEVGSLAHDRALRAYQAVILATIRTNYYRNGGRNPRTAIGWRAVRVLQVRLCAVAGGDQEPGSSMKSGCTSSRMEGHPPAGRFRGPRRDPPFRPSGRPSAPRSWD